METSLAHSYAYCVSDKSHPNVHIYYCQPLLDDRQVALVICIILITLHSMQICGGSNDFNLQAKLYHTPFWDVGTFVPYARKSLLWEKSLLCLLLLSVGTCPDAGGALHVVLFKALLFAYTQTCNCRT